MPTHGERERPARKRGGTIAIPMKLVDPVRRRVVAAAYYSMAAQRVDGTARGTGHELDKQDMNQPTLPSPVPTSTPAGSASHITRIMPTGNGPLA